MGLDKDLEDDIKAMFDNPLTGGFSKSIVLRLLKANERLEHHIALLSSRPDLSHDEIERLLNEQ